MSFSTWSWFHFLYLASPIIFLVILWLCLKKATDKTKYIIGIIIGCLGLSVLITRNLHLLIENGWTFSKETVPLQLCHLGNIIVFVALVFKNKVAAIMAWCVNLPAAIAAMVFADGLFSYSNLLKVLPQAYIWGHILIVVGAIYFIMFYKKHITKKDFLYSIIGWGILIAIILICNPLINYYTGQEANFFYIYSYKGTPFKALYNLSSLKQYGWFSINWIYTLIMLIIGCIVVTGMYYLNKLISNKKRPKI